MPDTTGVPAFGGYVALPSAHADGLLIAYWQDGSAARLVDRMDEAEWVPLPRPDFASLFPDRVTREPEPMPEGVWVPWAGPERVLGMPFRGDLPDQPRPDDADPLEYPPHVAERGD